MELTNVLNETFNLKDFRFYAVAYDKELSHFWGNSNILYQAVYTNDPIYINTIIEEWEKDKGLKNIVFYDIENEKDYKKLIQKISNCKTRKKTNEIPPRKITFRNANNWTKYDSIKNLNNK